MEGVAVPRLTVDKSVSCEAGLEWEEGEEEDVAAPAHVRRGGRRRRNGDGEGGVGLKGEGGIGIEEGRVGGTIQI